MRVTRFSIFLAVLISANLSSGNLSTTTTPILQKSDPALQENNWELLTSYDFPVWLALNHPPAKGKMQEREIFLFIEAAYFKRENIIKVISGLAAEYPEPMMLNITAFSDKAMLKRAITMRDPGFDVHFVDTPEGRKAAREFYDTYYPLRSGYYRAYYYRHWDSVEKLQYSPDPDKEDHDLIILQDKPISPYTGEVNVDLTIAALEGDTEKVKSLLATGANVNARNEYGETALMLAARRGHQRIAKILVTFGADVKAKKGDGTTALQYAATEGRAEIVKALLAKGADVNTVDNDKYSALIGAASNGHAETVKVLLENGAEINTKNRLGATALINAAKYKREEVVKILLANGADVTPKDIFGETALKAAQERGYKSIVELLKMAGARE